MKASFGIAVMIVLSLLTEHTVLAQTCNCGNNAKKGVSAPPTECPKPGGDFFEPYTGNVQREITDLEQWGSVGELPMVWNRYYTSRGNILWNYSFVYAMYDGPVVGGQPTIVVDYPEGGQNSFVYDPLNPTQWQSLPGIDRRLFQYGSDFYLQMADGFRYHFVKHSIVIGPNTYYYYLLQNIRDSKKNLYRLTYTVNRQLDSVIEPGGRFFKIHYVIVGGRRLIGQVSTRDGRSVQYQYDIYNDGVSKWIRLLRAVYGDATQSFYAYSQSSPGGSLRLAHAIDPRFRGASVNMIFTYEWSCVAGYLKEERNGLTGEVMASMSSTATDRTVCYANGRQEVFNMPHNMLGNRKSYTDGLGRMSKYGYDFGGQGFRTKDTDALNRVTTYNTRTAYGNLLKMTYPDGSQTSWTRDSLDQVLTQTDELGRVTTYTYDASHRVTRIDYPDASFETYTYNSFGQVLNHQHRNGGAEQYTYDSRGLKTSHTDALGNLTTYTYDGADRLASVTDARGNTTAYQYNERGLMTKLTHPDLSFQSYTYDAFGNQVTRTDEMGHTWTTSYDEFRRPVTMTDPLSRTTQYSYDLPGGICGCAHENNKPTAITLPSGRVTRFTYDVEWQTLTKTEGAGTADSAVTRYEYDMVGNLVKIIDPKLNEWEMEYDLRDRRTAEIAPLGQRTEWTYDAVGNVLTHERPDNGVTTYTYDNMNRRTQLTDPKSQVTQYAYDADGNLVSLTDPKGNVYAYQYDLLDRLTRLTYPGGSFEQFSYDAVDNLATYTNRAGAVRTYTYDSRNRETLSDWSDATPDVSTTYDADGRMLTRTSSVSALSYTYDNANQMITESQNIAGSGGGNKSITYSYNADGLHSSMLYPSGNTVSYTYTSRNQMATISENGPPPLTTYTYDVNGNRISKLLKNGVQTNYSYDNNNRLLTVNNSLSSVSFARFDYGYDQVNNRKFAQRDLNLGDVYAYDAIDQATGVLYDATNPAGLPSAPARTVSYGLDASGNRTSVTDNLVPTSYTSNSQNQYTNVGGNALTHGANGELASSMGWTYSYDAQSRLISAQNGPVLVSFAYDPANRCVIRTVNGTANYLYYSGWSLIEERLALDFLNARYVHGSMMDELITRHAGGASTYFHYDAPGNAAGITNASGVVLEKYSYDIFGAPTIRNGAGVLLSSTDIRFLFSGREYIREIGLYDFRHRMYDPLTGRFIQTDPAKFYVGDYDMYIYSGDYNLYRYVWNNPVNLRDLLGLWALGTGKAPASANTIVCDGKGGIRVQIGSTFSAILLPCVIEHEEGHKADALASKPDLCKGAADGNSIIFSSKEEQNASEIRCSNIEIDCLKKAKCTTEDEKKTVANRIKQMEQYRDSFK